MKKEVRSLISKLNKCKKNIAKERDTLRDLIDEYNCIQDSADIAIEELESAADILSEYL